MREETDINPDSVVIKNISNKRLSKMEFDEKFDYLHSKIFFKKSIKKCFMLTGTSVMNLSEQIKKKYSVKTYTIENMYYKNKRILSISSNADTIDS